MNMMQIIIRTDNCSCMLFALPVKHGTNFALKIDNNFYMQRQGHA